MQYCMGALNVVDEPSCNGGVKDVFYYIQMTDFHKT